MFYLVINWITCTTITLSTRSPNNQIIMRGTLSLPISFLISSISILALSISSHSPLAARFLQGKYSRNIEFLSR